MKLLILMLLAGEVYAQNCYPQDRVVSERFVGCNNTLKNVVTQVSFDNGFSKTVSQTGTGQCARDNTCNWWEFPPTVECWPTFNQPIKRDGYWSQTVIDSRIVMDYNVSCPGDNGTAVLILGAQCAPNGNARTEEVTTSCAPAGGVVLTVPGVGSTLDDPCYWPSTFFPGMPSCTPPWWQPGPW